jgi:hypothetical protein
MADAPPSDAGDGPNTPVERFAAAVGALGAFVRGHDDGRGDAAGIDARVRAVADAALAGGYSRDATYAVLGRMLRDRPDVVGARLVQARAAVDRFAGLLPPADSPTDTSRP